MKHKLSKADEKWLRAESKLLPPDKEATATKLGSGKRMANIIPVNHTRRLLKAFAGSGNDGVQRYLDKYRTPETKYFKITNT